MFSRLTFIVPVVLTLTSLTRASFAIGQPADSVELAAIPHKLFWQNQPVKFTAAHNQLVIVAGEKTDMFRDPNVTYQTDNAPKLLFEADSNFVLSASIEHSFSSKWDGGAMVIWHDSLHWVKFCFEKDYTGAKRVVSVVTNDLSDDCNSVQIQSNRVYYKVAKAGDVITLYYSIEGKKWFLVRHFSFPQGKSVKVGFLAQSPTGKQCQVRFSAISYQAKKIEDPYAGE